MWLEPSFVSSLVSRTNLRDPEVHRTGHAEVFHHALACNVRSSCPKLLSQTRFNQRDPTGDAFHLVSWGQHSTVCALYEFAASLSTLATPARPSLLRHLFEFLPRIGMSFGINLFLQTASGPEGSDQTEQVLTFSCRKQCRLDS